MSQELKPTKGIFIFVFVKVLKLKKSQQVEFVGTIEDIYSTLGFTVELRDVEFVQ